MRVMGKLLPTIRIRIVALWMAAALSACASDPYKVPPIDIPFDVSVVGSTLSVDSLPEPCDIR